MPSRMRSASCATTAGARSCHPTCRCPGSTTGCPTSSARSGSRRRGGSTSCSPRGRASPTLTPNGCATCRCSCPPRTPATCTAGRPTCSRSTTGTAFSPSSARRGSRRRSAPTRSTCWAPTATRANSPARRGSSSARSRCPSTPASPRASWIAWPLPLPRLSPEEPQEPALDAASPVFGPHRIAWQVVLAKHELPFTADCEEFGNRSAQTLGWPIRGERASALEENDARTIVRVRRKADARGAALKEAPAKRLCDDPRLARYVTDVEVFHPVSIQQLCMLAFERCSDARIRQVDHLIRGYEVRRREYAFET